MSVFLIQTSGHTVEDINNPEYAAVAKARRLCDELFYYEEYVNASPYWQETGFGRHAAWQSVEPGDDVLIYCTGSVDEYGASLSHIATVADVDIEPSTAARLHFASVDELDPAISYNRLMRECDAGRLSESMQYCGQEGFNFTQVTEADWARIQALTDPVDSTATGPRESLQDIADAYFEE